MAIKKTTRGEQSLWIEYRDMFGTVVERQDKVIGAAEMHFAEAQELADKLNSPITVVERAQAFAADTKRIVHTRSTTVARVTPNQ